jgi:2-polyprenyl-6-methoxyphenol hydroxylase-like FAD-dependent oxidoreductase
MEAYDIVVAGAGPVGLLLACELRLAGIRTLVLERLPEPAGHDRAGVLHTRTLETLDIRGLFDEFSDGHDTVEGLPFAAMIKAPLKFRLMNTSHQYSLLIPQSQSEARLRERAAALGTEIRRGHELTGLTQDAEGVTIEVAAPDGTRQVRASYLVGCDGAHSTVRRLAGIEFPGKDPSVSALIGYVTLTEQNVPRRWERTPTGQMVMAFPPEGGIGRVVMVEYGRTVADRDAPVTLEEMRAASVRLKGREFRFTEPVLWMSRFNDSSRRAEPYRQGRVLVAGDAAHIHFPIGGQGLNMGLQDAMNLGWKLAAVVSGRVHQDLLDTYHEERAPVADMVLRNTRAQLALMNPDEHHVTPLRELFQDMMKGDELNRYLSAMISGTATRYGAPGPDEHPLAGAFAPDVDLKTASGPTRPAELLRSGRGLFLEVAGRADLRAIAEGWADRVTITSASVPEQSLGTEAILIRPDGYTAWAARSRAEDAAEDADGLRKALTRWFGA